jgi:hypothetical protein
MKQSTIKILVSVIILCLILKVVYNIRSNKDRFQPFQDGPEAPLPEPIVLIYNGFDYENINFTVLRDSISERLPVSNVDINFENSYIDAIKVILTFQNQNDRDKVSYMNLDEFIQHTITAYHNYINEHYGTQTDVYTDEVVVVKDENKIPKDLHVPKTPPAPPPTIPNPIITTSSKEDKLLKDKEIFLQKKEKFLKKKEDYLENQEDLLQEKKEELKLLYEIPPPLATLPPSLPIPIPTLPPLPPPKKHTINFVLLIFLVLLVILFLLS